MPADSRRTTGIVYHPRYERFLRRCGIDSASAALSLRGEVVCGHPDRHVVRCELQPGRVVYLKREHVVGVRTRLRNRLDGFGPVSRSEREAAVLSRLEAAGLPGPQWLAFGEGADGRAFLLVDEIVDAEDLRSLLSDTALSPAERREVIARAGRAVAELHAAGFGTPDLAAKHVLVNRQTFAVTIVDWQSVRLSAGDPARQLAGLHASLAAGLASPRERLRFVRAYLRGEVGTRFREFTRTVVGHAGRLGSRSSSRDQRAALPAPRLVWLAGEEACVVAEMADVWPTPAAGPPFYDESGAGEEWITFPDGRRARLARFTSFDPVGRFTAAVRERPWRSRAARVARLLFHLHRHGVEAPRLLAFGQRLTGRATADSFVLFEPIGGAAPVASELAERGVGDATCRTLLRACGQALRRLHDAGCRLVRGANDGPVLVAAPAGVAVASPWTVRLTRHVADSVRRADLRWLLSVEFPGLSRSDRGRVLRGYTGTEVSRTRFAAGVL